MHAVVISVNGQSEKRLAIEDGVTEISPETCHHRCWVYKTMNMLNYLPQSVRAKDKGFLHEIWMASTHRKAYKVFDRFIQVWPR